MEQEIEIKQNKLVEPIIDEVFKNEFVISKTDNKDKEKEKVTENSNPKKTGFRNTMTNIYDDLEKTFEKIEQESQLSKSNNWNEEDYKEKNEGKITKHKKEINIYNRNPAKNVITNESQKSKIQIPKKLIYTPKTYNPNLKVKSEGLKQFIMSGNKQEKKKQLTLKSAAKEKPAKPASAKELQNFRLSKFRRKNLSCVYSQIPSESTNKIHSAINQNLFRDTQKQTTKTGSSLFNTSNSKFIKKRPIPASKIMRSFTSNFPIKKNKQKTKSLVMTQNLSRDASPFVKSMTAHQRKVSINSVENPNQEANKRENTLDSRNQSRQKFRVQMKNYIDSAYRNKQSLQTIHSNLSGVPGGRQYTTQSTNLSPHRHSQHFYQSEIHSRLGQEGRIQFIDLTNNYSQEVKSARANNPTSKSVMNSFQGRSDAMTWIPDTQSISREDLENKLLSLFKKMLVYCSKIEALKEKLLGSKNEFSVYSLFKRFCIKKREMMTPIEFSNFTRMFGFKFSQQIVVKMMLFLKRFKTFVKEKGTGWLQN